MAFATVWASGTPPTMLITVPKTVGSELDIKIGDELWVDWATIVRQTNELRQVADTHAAYRQSTGIGDEKNGRQETRSSKDVPRRRSERQGLGERDHGAR